MKGAIAQILIGLILWLIVPELLPRKYFKKKKLFTGVRIIVIALGILLLAGGVVTLIKSLIFV